MEKLELFLKKNKIVKENILYPATAAILDENGNPVEWELRAVSTKENNLLIEESTKYTVAENGEIIPTFDNNLYVKKLVAAAVVYPDLHNRSLQDSYGVMTPEDLLEAIVDYPEEFNMLAKKVKEQNGIGKKNEAKEIKEAKN